MKDTCRSLLPPSLSSSLFFSLLFFPALYVSLLYPLHLPTATDAPLRRNGAFRRERENEGEGGDAHVVPTPSFLLLQFFSSSSALSASFLLRHLTQTNAHPMVTAYAFSPPLSLSLSSPLSLSFHVLRFEKARQRSPHSLCRVLQTRRISLRPATPFVIPTRPS